MIRVLLFLCPPMLFYSVRSLAGLGTVLFTMMFIIGCASSSPLHNQSTMTDKEIERNLRIETQRWEGTPHRMGGTNRRGVDCSGLVQAVYQDVFGLPLPRTTADQVHTGEKVSRNQLAPGDLVFFRLSSKTRHVGIYLSDGEFAHASSSRGVTISHLEQPYWQNRYWTARRVLQTTTTRTDNQEPRRVRQSEPVASTPSTRSDRTGW